MKECSTRIRDKADFMGILSTILHYRTYGKYRAMIWTDLYYKLVNDTTGLGKRRI